MKARARHWLVSAAAPLLRTASRAYVPGPLVADALAWAQRAQKHGVATTIGYFNADDERPTDVMQASLHALDALASLQLRGYLSVKVPALAYDTELLGRLALASQSRDMLLHFDSHGPETADATLRALQAQCRDGLRLGLTVPGRWLRSLDDAEWALQRGVRVRVVKGQWACPQEPHRDACEGFLAVVDRLAGRAAEVAVATHDAPLARAAVRHLRRAGTACELELLPGLPRRAVLAVAEELHVPVRLYIPFGQAWMPYALGHVVRNPGLMLRTLRDSMSGLLQGRSLS
jgi:proline dehydrogenase